MPLFVLILSGLFVASPTPTPIISSSDLCPKPTVTTESATFKRLGDLPPAQVTQAVFRPSPCPVPVVLARDRIGPVPKTRR